MFVLWSYALMLSLGAARTANKIRKADPERLDEAIGYLETRLEFLNHQVETAKIPPDMLEAFQKDQGSVKKKVRWRCCDGCAISLPVHRLRSSRRWLGK